MTLKDTLKEYRMFTRTTAVYPKEKGMLYCTLGLQNEIGELITKIFQHSELDEEFTGEAGDILWYITRLSDELEINLEDIVTSDEYTQHPKKFLVPAVFKLEECVGNAFGMLKKSIRGDKEFDKKAIAEKMRIVMGAYQILIAIYGLKLTDVVKQNTEKLSSRKERGKIKGDGDHR